MNTQNTPLAHPEVPLTMRGIVTKNDLPAEYGISGQTAWRLGRDDPTFPRRVMLTSDRVGWFRHELDKYFLERPRGSTTSVNSSITSATG